MHKLAVLIPTLTASIAAAQPAPEPAPPPPDDCCDELQASAQALPAPAPVAPVQAPSPDVAATTEPAGYRPSLAEQSDDGGWRRPPGQRFLHGFRLGYMFLMNGDAKNRTPKSGDEMVSITEKYELKTPHMMLIGYEGFYRIIGHSWLNVLLVGNVSVAGLEQSKFIPAASGLLGFEFDQSFQLGVGVNVTPDEDAPTHAIFAAGWTPRVGSIHMPVHFFFVPEPGVNGEKGNHRVGGTVGVTW
jgi:hypothetical protein